MRNRVQSRHQDLQHLHRKEVDRESLLQRPSLNLKTCLSSKLFFFLGILCTLLCTGTCQEIGRTRDVTSSCAWLEKGGFFTRSRHYNSSKAFVQVRSSCRYSYCNYNWARLTDLYSLTFKWIGTDDMRDYTFQMHFCEPIYTPQHNYCTGGPEEVAYELRQIGTWLFVARVNCRCFYPAEISTIIYSTVVAPADPVFRGSYMQMACRQTPMCQAVNSPCYREPVQGYGDHIYTGNVLCTCGRKQFCPIYFIGGKREPEYDASDNEPNPRPKSYIVRCQPRSI